MPGRLDFNHSAASSAAANFSGSVDTSGALLGIGASYAITSKISARAEIQRPTDKIVNFNVGMLFGFK